MTNSILVTGGTGTLGRQVVRRLRDAGHDVRVLSRNRGDLEDGVEHVAANLATGERVDEAVWGTKTILHLAGSAKGDDVKARHLVQVAAKSGIRHLVYISVVGADRIPAQKGIDRAMFGYFGAKLAAEHIVADSGVPWTILRATQFHDLTLKTVEGMARMPVITVPSGFRFQPVDSGEVADRLVELAFQTPAGLVPDLAGPRIYGMDELVRSYLRASGRYRPIMPIWLPGKAARATRNGANLSPERAVGIRSWEEFLAERFPVPAKGRIVLASS